nr:reverse transcriptase domain-containing protein [Tanacetum cinerariifolium]
MSTRSSARNLFPPLDNPKLTIRRRSRVDPTPLNDFVMATDGNGDPPVPDLRTMEELCQPSLNGRGDDANKHLDKFLHVTHGIKVNGVTDDALRLHHDTINAAAGGTFMKMRPEECYDLIENTTAHYNDWDTSAQWSESSSSITSSSDQEIIALKAEMAEINKNLMKVLQINHQVKALTPSCETCGVPHSYNDCPATVGQTQNVYAAGAYQGGNSYQPEGTLPSNTITNPKEDLKGITTRSGTAYQGPTIPTTSSSLPQVVERETDVTKDTMPPTNNRSTKDVQPSVVQTETLKPNSEPVVAPVIEPIVAPVSALKPNKKPSISYSSRLHDQKLRDKANDQKVKIFQIFKDLDFNISFANALILMPKFGPTIKILLTNKEKLYELARTPLNGHCSAVLLKTLPEKLGDPDKFLIPCDFSRMDECLALADLGTSINIMPLSVWNKLSLLELTPILMTLELADQSISRPIGVVEDVFIKVGKFHFPADFIVEVLDLSDVIASGNPTPYYDPIISTSSTLTPFRDSDFLLEEVDAFLALEDDPTSPKVDQSYYDTEGDILLLEAFLNDDPSLPPPTQGIHLLQIRKELKI